MLNLKLGSSSIGESSSAGLTSSDGPAATSSLQPMARPEDTEYSGEDEQSDEDEDDDDEERTLMTGAASASSVGVGRALVGGASAAGIDSRSKSGDGFSRPKAPLAKQ